MVLITIRFRDLPIQSIMYVKLYFHRFPQLFLHLFLTPRNQMLRWRPRAHRRMASDLVQYKDLYIYNDHINIALA